MTRFLGKKLLDVKFFDLIFTASFLSEKLPILINIHRYISRMYILKWLNCNKTVIFLTDFSKNTQMSNFMKMRPEEAELFHADGRADRPTDITKLKVTIRNIFKRA